MEIGATNVSAIFGPHVPSIAMATEKFTLPYLVLSAPQHAMHRAENLITVHPAPEDIFKLTADLLKYLQWRDVAIIYDSDEGNVPSFFMPQLYTMLFAIICIFMIHRLMYRTYKYENTQIYIFFTVDFYVTTHMNLKPA